MKIRWGDTWRSLAWLIRDTLGFFRYGRAGWLLLGASGIAIALCLSARVSQDTPGRTAETLELTDAAGEPLTSAGERPGRLGLGFGLLRVKGFRDGAAAAHFLESLLARWAACGVGVLLLLIASAGNVPEILRPESASLLLTRPVPYVVLLAGRVLGAIGFAALHCMVFFGGTWLALGLMTGYWDTRYLICIPLVVAQFALVYPFSVLIGVWTRSSFASAIGGACFWCLGMLANQAQLAQAGASTAMGEAAGLLKRPVELGYWLLPKPADFQLMLERALGAAEHFPLSTSLQAAAQASLMVPWASLLTSMLTGVLILWVAARELRWIEY